MFFVVVFKILVISDSNVKDIVGNLSKPRRQNSQSIG